MTQAKEFIDAIKSRQCSLSESGPANLVRVPKEWVDRLDELAQHADQPTPPIDLDNLTIQPAWPNALPAAEYAAVTGQGVELPPWPENAKPVTAFDYWWKQEVMRRIGELEKAATPPAPVAPAEQERKSQPLFDALGYSGNDVVLQCMGCGNEALMPKSRYKAGDADYVIVPAARAGSEEVERLRAEQRQTHHVACNHRQQPIGGPGCICVVMSNRSLEALTAERDALAERERGMREALELFRRAKSKIGGLSYDGLPHEDIRNDLDQADAMAAVAISLSPSPPQEDATSKPITTPSPERDAT